MQKLTPVQWLLVAVGAVAVLVIVGLSYYLGVSSDQSVQVIPRVIPVQNISPTQVVPTATPTPTPVPKTGTPVHTLVPNYQINNNAAK